MGGLLDGVLACFAALLPRAGNTVQGRPCDAAHEEGPRVVAASPPSQQESPLLRTIDIHSLPDDVLARIAALLPGTRDR